MKVIQCKNRITVTRDSGFKNTEWEKVAFNYKAIGGENHITVGIFKEDYTKRMFHKMKNRNLFFKDHYSAYYFIDDICITTVDQIDLQEEHRPKFR